MGSSIVSGSDTSRHPADSLSDAREVFERIVAEFIARPQRWCNFEGLASAAVALHDAGLADLEYRHGRRSGSFGGRMSAGLVVRVGGKKRQTQRGVGANSVSGRVGAEPSER